MSNSTIHGCPAATALTEHRGFALLAKLGTACQKARVQQDVEKCKVKGSKADFEKLITDVVMNSGVLEDFDFEQTKEGIAMMSYALRDWLTLVRSSAEDKVSKHFTTLSLMEQLPPITPGFLTSSLQDDTSSPKNSVESEDASTDLTDGEERHFESESSAEFLRQSSISTHASEEAAKPPTDAQVALVKPSSDPMHVPEIRLTFSDAMALLTELRDAYLEEEFKDEKARIDSFHTCEIEEEYLDDVGNMVMRVLHFIFPKYGFEKNLKGAAQLKEALGKLLQELAENENDDTASLQLGLEKCKMMMPLRDWLVAKFDQDAEYNFLRLPQLPTLQNRRKERQVHRSSILVPNEKVGAIIGKQSVSRRQIECQSRARLIFNGNGPEDKHQLVTIIGDTLEGVRMAGDLIRERMQEYEKEDEKQESTQVFGYTVVFKSLEPKKEEKFKIKIDAVEQPTVLLIKKAAAKKLGCMHFSELEVVMDMFNGKYVKKLDTEQVVGKRVLVMKAEALADASAKKEPSPLTQLTKIIGSVNDALNVL